MQEVDRINRHSSKLKLILISFIILACFFLLLTIIGLIVNGLFEFDTTKEVYLLKGTNIELVPHVISIIIIAVILVALMVYINRKIKKADPLKKPKGILLLVEILVTTIDNFTVNMVGEKMKSLAPYLGYLAIYLFTANIFGLFGFTPPTANLSVTLTFGLTTFILIRYYGIKANGWGHFKSLFSPILLTPINIIGEIAVPFTLSIRLFGNILSGAIIMTLIYTGLGLGLNGLLTVLFHSNFGGIGELLTPFLGVPLFHIYFDLFSGFIQTFVFILLTSVFISNATN
ncbi:MAG TPA: F0F1 ATP synthase subunit A [Haloplasmataceae bacterium]